MKIENIKFKAKRLDGKGWVCGYFYEENDNTYIIENRQKESKLNRNPTYQVDPSTVCQFTGLKDKNGEEVWEHDLLKFITEREVIIGSTGIFLKRETHLLPLRETTIKDDKLVRWSNHGSKFDRKEGEKNDEEKNI
ncbi:MAG: YopX family protein [Anaerobutyricum soehngenii]